MYKQTSKILVGNGSSNLNSQIQLHLNEGWETSGGVSVTSYYDKSDKLVFQYVQGMILMEDEA